MARTGDFKKDGKKSRIRVDKPKPKPKPKRDPVPPEVSALDPEQLWNAVGDLIRHLYWEFERCEQLGDPEGFMLNVNGLREVVQVLIALDGLGVRRRRQLTVDPHAGRKCLASFTCGSLLL